ncbi:MAG: VWA domain-containing protein [Acidimicrobiia bacterium]|nr:VWA domain-containing protein [Acidimicrobiia bacterium]
MNLLAPAALALGALAIPLIVLYMLRSRRQRLEVSSVLLWQRADESVTSAVPWRRLELSPLLLLQLIVLALLVFALARPFFSQESLLGPHTVLVVDSSGSMAAADRFDKAIERAKQISADVSDANLVSVVEAGPRAAVVATFLRTEDAVSRALSSIEVTGGSADLDGAIRLGRSLATPDRPTNLVLLTDGSMAPLATEPVVGADHIRFSDTADNLSISGFSVEPSAAGVVRLFVNVTNHTGLAADVELRLLVNDLPSGAIELGVPPLSDAARTVPIDAGAGDLVVVERVGEPDGLALDDRASLVVVGGTERTVGVVGQGSAFLDVLVDIAPGFVKADPVDADVVIVDGGPLPEIDRPTWLIRPETPPSGVEFDEIATGLAATFQSPGEPILDAVDLSGLVVAEAQVAETFSWLPIVRAGDVPLVLLGEVDGHRVAYFTFDITRSNLPVQVGFPIMGSRILDWLGGASAGATDTAPAGTPIPISPPAGAATEISRDGVVVAELQDQVLSFDDTGTPGVYRVSYLAEDSRVAGPVAVRTFDRQESVAGSRDIAVVAGSSTATGEGSIIREWAPSVVAATIAIVLFEWWFAHRRRRTVDVVA